MLSTLGPARTSLRLPGADHRRRPVFAARWIGTRPRRRSGIPRVRLAEGVWIVPARVAGTTTSRRFSPPDWMEQGLCAQLPMEWSDSLFFGVEHRAAPGALIAAANAAREICARCPVLALCLTNALISDERYGVWGGTSGRQRSKLRVRLSAGAGVDELVAECLGAVA